ncbi:MAG: ParB/RepB/Spo0J family partition protein [Parcubacteria group bacterium]|nr:ParB/RepB/Spo0J family partition protein [Parcubacteria group bacterium]
MDSKERARAEVVPLRSSSVERVERIPRVKIRRFEGQPRTFFDPGELSELAASIEEVGQQTPILVKRVSGDQKHDYELIDGERRWLACGMVGVETLLALVKEPRDSEDQFLGSVVANFGRVGHTPLETAKAIERLRASKQMQRYSAGEQVERIAKICARSAPWVYQHLALLRLDPKVQAMMEPSVPKDKRLDISIALYLTSLHTELQLEIAEEVVRKGLKLKEARFHARKVAQRVGIQAGVAKRGRRPHDDYRILQRFAVSFLKEARMFLEMSPDYFENMFKKRDPKERATLIQDFEQGIAQLKKLRDVLARIK